MTGDGSGEPAEPSAPGHHRSTGAARHVALVSPGFPADEGDTSCIPPLQVALRALARRHPEITVTVIALHYPHGRGSTAWHGIPVHRAGGDNRALPARVPALARAVRAIRRSHRERPFDAVHALWLADTALVAWWAARRLGLPLVATVMGQDARRTNRWLRVLPLGAARLAAVSDRASAELGRATGRAADAVVPWGLDPPGGEAPSWDERPVDLLGVGALTDNKDFAVMIEAVARLRAAGRSCRAVLVGDGPCRSDLERLIAAHGVGDAVRLEGRLPRAGVIERMRSARVLVHPARYEGFGFVFAEALAHGMTVLSRPVGAARASDRWRVVETVEGFASVAAAVLDEPPGTRPVTLWTEDEAADAWAALYRASGDPA